MSPQETIRELIFELLQAMKEYPYKDQEIIEILNALPGIREGTFFSLTHDEQRHSLGWVNGAFFGRGERATPLLKKGFLREDFPQEFDRAIRIWLWGHE